MSAYLSRLIGDYLKEIKLTLNRETSIRVTAGVPQRSVLGPTLWNVADEGVLRLA